MCCATTDSLGSGLVSTQIFRVDRRSYKEIQEDESEFSGDDHARSIGSETARGDCEMQSERQWEFPSS